MADPRVGSGGWSGPGAHQATVGAPLRSAGATAETARFRHRGNAHVIVRRGLDGVPSADGGGRKPLKGRRSSLMLARQRSQGANEIDWMDVRKRMMRSSASNPLHKLSPGARHILVTWIEDQAKRRLKAKQMRALDRRLARKHLQLFLLGLLGVLLMIYDEEKRWDKGEQYEYGMENLAPLVGSSWTDLVIPACNILLVWRMGDLYRELAEKKRRKWHLQSRWDAFWNSSLKWKFSLEVAICIVQPPPWIVYTVEFPGDSWVRHIGLFMFMRVYMVARILKDTSLVYRMRHKAYRTGQLTSSSLGFFMTLRAELKRRPLAVVLTAITATVLIFTYAIYVIERQSLVNGDDPSIDTFVKAFWFVIVTLTTVGYGDTYPSTAKGYYPAMLEGFIAMVLTSMLVAVVIEKLNMTGDEKDMYEWVVNRLQKKRVGEARARLVKDWLRHMISRWRQRRQSGHAKLTQGEAAAVRQTGGPSPFEDLVEKLPDPAVSSYFRALKPAITRYRREKARLRKTRQDAGDTASDHNAPDSVNAMLWKYVELETEYRDSFEKMNLRLNNLSSAIRGLSREGRTR